jgi:hypothetical protein
MIDSEMQKWNSSQDNENPLKYHEEDSQSIKFQKDRSRLCSALEHYEKNLSIDFSKEDLDLDSLFEKHFKKNRLNEFFIPLYIDYYTNNGTNETKQVSKASTGGTINCACIVPLEYCKQRNPQ